MCIRDSFTQLVGHAGVEKNALGRGGLASVNVGRDTDIAVAVSYTHLRAHETVLDLVCRLLLEKKK